VAEHADDPDITADQLAQRGVGEGPIPCADVGLDTEPVKILARPAGARLRHHLGRHSHALGLEEARGEVGIDPERPGVERRDGLARCGFGDRRAAGLDRGGKCKQRRGRDAQREQEWVQSFEHGVLKIRWWGGSRKAQPCHEPSTGWSIAESRRAVEDETRAGCDEKLIPS
jgi:hypothetical protein